LRVIFHAGTHKTGTTSIQMALDLNRYWLQERGYLYPKLREGVYNHNELAQILARAEWANLDLRSEISAAAGDTLILSAEELWAVTACPEDWEEFCRPDYWQRRIEQLRRVRAALRAFDAVAVYLCFRRQDEFATSLYAAKILNGRFRGSFEEFRSRSRPLFDYRRQLDAFRAVFGDVRVISFDAIKSDLVPGFCSWTDIPVPPRKLAKLQNVTPDARLVRWAYARRTTADSERLNRLRISFARSEDAISVLPSVGKASFWSSDLERHSFLAECVDPEPGLFPTADGTFGDEPDLFPAVDDEASDFGYIDAAFEAWRLTHQKSRVPHGTRIYKSAVATRIWSFVRRLG
jgi:hypothetical protein